MGGRLNLGFMAFIIIIIYVPVFYFSWYTNSYNTCFGLEQRVGDEPLRNAVTISNILV